LKAGFFGWGTWKPFPNLGCYRSGKKGLEIMKAEGETAGRFGRT